MVCNGAYSQANLSIYQGDDYSAVVEVLYLDGSQAAITGYTAKAQIRKGYADNNEDVVVEIACYVNSPFINIDIPRAETVGLVGTYAWDLQLTSPEDIVVTILSGTVTVSQEVTR
jgi:hypothetical protein